jgi:hypothetical protein
MQLREHGLNLKGKEIEVIFSRGSVQIEVDKRKKRKNSEFALNRTYSPCMHHLKRKVDVKTNQMIQ